jgi:hypothetical protein
MPLVGRVVQLLYYSIDASLWNLRELMGWRPVCTLLLCLCWQGGAAGMMHHYGTLGNWWAEDESVPYYYALVGRVVHWCSWHDASLWNLRELMGWRPVCTLLLCLLRAGWCSWHDASLWNLRELMSWRPVCTLLLCPLRAGWCGWHDASLWNLGELMGWRPVCTLLLCPCGQGGAASLKLDNLNWCWWECWCIDVNLDV